MKNDPCAGYIQLVFFDDATNEVITLGGAGFMSEHDHADAWAAVPEFVGESSFMADLMNANQDITEDRRISAETCEMILGKSVAELIAAGRKSLTEDLARTCLK